MFRTKNNIISLITGIMVLFFFQSAHADLGSAAKVKEALAIQSAIGTDSAGSYVHGEKKVEGSKQKGYTHPHKKSEGSGSKSYSHGKSSHGAKGSHSYGHKKSEGSGSKSYSHGKNRHGYKSSYGKSHGYKKGSSHGGHGGHGSSPFKHVMHYKYKLGLTDAQIKTMKKLDVDFKKKIIQAKADHEMAHLELDLQVHSGDVDEGKIRAAGAKIVASKSDKIMAMIEAKIQLLKLLTAEQRQKMAKMH